MHYCVLFPMRWCVAMDDGRFVVDGHFFLPSFLSLLEKVHIYPLIFRFVNSNPYIFFIFIFILGSIIKFLNVFNLTIELQFVIYYFSNSILILLNYDFFFLGSFVKVLLVFNFILQSKFMLFYCFQSTLILLI
jgi:hypothetical protein